MRFSQALYFLCPYLIRLHHTALKSSLNLLFWRIPPVCWWRHSSLSRAHLDKIDGLRRLICLPEHIHVPNWAVIARQRPHFISHVSANPLPFGSHVCWLHRLIPSWSPGTYFRFSFPYVVSLLPSDATKTFILSASRPSGGVLLSVCVFISCRRLHSNVLKKLRFQYQTAIDDPFTPAALSIINVVDL